MPLASFDHLCIGFGLHDLLADASFQLEAGERVCLIGRNGAGKSTLLKIVEGEVLPDGGEIWRQPGLRIARLEQEPRFDPAATTFDVVAGGLAGIGRLLAEYHHVTHEIARDPTLASRMERLHAALDASDGWSLGQRVDQVLARLEIAPDAVLGELSGGWKRRVALARALVSEPDLLLLDEPTNHLDVEVIQWLEDRLLEFRGGVLFVTHDRALLSRLATRILELDRGRLTSWPGDYPGFLEKKASALEQEERQSALFDRKLAEEEAWIRRGIRARRTRNEGRVRALEAMREERRQRRDVQGRATFDIESARDSGKLVVDAENVSYGWDGIPIVRDFSIRILRGERIGLIGPNGAGKTTLLRLLLGQLAPRSGRIRLGTRLEIAYYDQLREQLDPAKSVIENLSEGREHIEIAGERRHVIGYLQDFLFSPERARSPVSALSGGERNRLLLARLFSRATNLLVLDEPTNDLDIETLELLEELLMSYPGTLLLVSHDRAFVDNVVTSTLVFEGEGRIQEYVGGYGDWLRRRRAAATAAASVTRKPVAAAATTRATAVRKTRLSQKERDELAELPNRISQLEAEQGRLAAALGDAAFYRQDAAEQTRLRARLAAIPTELEAAFARWEALDAREG